MTLSTTDKQALPAPALWLSGVSEQESKHPAHEIAEILRSEVNTTLLAAPELREQLQLNHVPNPLDPIMYLIKQLQTQEVFVLVSWDLSNKDESARVKRLLMNTHIVSLEPGETPDQQIQEKQNQSNSQQLPESEGNPTDHVDTPVDLRLDGTADREELVNQILVYIDKHQLKNYNPDFSSEEEEEVTDRLKNLGYI